MAEAETKTAIVTGAAGGVARALIPMLIGDGYRVALIDVNAIGLGNMVAKYGDAVDHGAVRRCRSRVDPA
jgi:NADP-dependent 3-hydroxy acid dehydrogenase YdfG